MIKYYIAFSPQQGVHFSSINIEDVDQNLTHIRL